MSPSPSTLGWYPHARRVSRYVSKLRHVAAAAVRRLNNLHLHKVMLAQCGFVIVMLDYSLHIGYQIIFTVDNSPAGYATPEGTVFTNSPTLSKHRSSCFSDFFNRR
jgi:hypothetical protein